MAGRKRELNPGKTKQLMKAFCLMVAAEQLSEAGARKPTFQELERAAAGVEAGRAGWPRSMASRWEDFAVAQTASKEQWQTSVLGQQNALRDRENLHEVDPVIVEVRGQLHLPSLTNIQRSSSTELELGRFLTDLDPSAPLCQPDKFVPPEPTRHLEMDRAINAAGRQQLMRYLGHLETSVHWDTRRGRRRMAEPAQGYIRVVQASGLKKADSYDASDPFARVR